MSFTASFMNFEETGNFSALVLDYLKADESLKSFYRHPATLEGIKQSIEERKGFKTDRKLLVDQLKFQYRDVSPNSLQLSYIEKLLQENTFTITTAHQPNIFTGHLYFIYKIMHAIKMADELQKLIPENNFVPVYYMGSEDADLEELGEVVVAGKKLVWETKQTGAVGRMHIDAAFLKIIKEIGGQIGVQQFGAAMISKMEKAYTIGKSIETATFEFVNDLFASFGLIILLPDEATLKKSFEPVIKKEIEEQFSSRELQKTIAAFPPKYKIQAAGRDLNLFYLDKDSRQRLLLRETGFAIENTDRVFTKQTMLEEIENEPRNFSANVILRPLYQEYILPNIVFIGGGGELAYWLELKSVFAAASIPYPVLMLRNSFALLDKKTAAAIKKLNFSFADFFKGEHELINAVVQRDSENKISVSEEKFALLKIYSTLRKDAAAVDKSLERHVWALQAKAINHIDQLEKKMIRSAKKGFKVQIKNISKIKSILFPAGTLQERVEGLLYFYSEFGTALLQDIYENSPALEPKFVLLTEKKVAAVKKK